MIGYQIDNIRWYIHRVFSSIITCVFKFLAKLDSWICPLIYQEHKFNLEHLDWGCLYCTVTK